MTTPIARAAFSSFIACSIAAALAMLLAACGGGGSSAVAPPSGLPTASSQPHSSPSPTPSPAATETPPAPSQYLDDTWTGIHVFQPFDDFDNKYVISPSQAQADGPRYAAVWGSNSGAMTAAWKTNNATLRTSYYIPIGTDALTNQFGDLGHGLAWWNANHPDWVLYECDEQTVAFVGNLPEVPLDISNPAVISYLENTIGTYAEANGYSAIGADFAELNNPTGGGKGGSRGCGVWTSNHTVWVQKFSGQQNDPAYAAAVLGWLSSFHSYLHALSTPLALWGNNVPGDVGLGNSGEQQIVSDLDIVEDESGDARYGKFANDGYFNNRVAWARDIQGLGKGYMPTALFHVSQLTDPQIDYAIASYLMSKEQASAITADPYGLYGMEHYYPAYQAAIGSPCAEMYGGKKYDGQLVYFRTYGGALAIENTSGSHSYTVTLPHQSYIDAVSGATVTSPLQVPPFSGFVLLTPNGCS